VKYCVTVQGDDYFEACGSPLVGQLDEPDLQAETPANESSYGMTHTGELLLFLVCRLCDSLMSHSALSSYKMTKW
jgi:hypothetical protein